MRSETFSERRGPAGLSAGWEKWDPVIMDQLGPVGTAMIERLGIAEDQQHLDIAPPYVRHDHAGCGRGPPRCPDRGPPTPIRAPRCAMTTLGNCIRWASRIGLSESWRPEAWLLVLRQRGLWRGSLIS